MDASLINAIYAPSAVEIVKHVGTAAGNGAALIAAYARAKLMTPNGAALSATNRALVLVPPGVYDVGTTRLEIDTDFVDVEGFGVCRADYRDSITRDADGFITAMDWSKVVFTVPQTVITGTGDIRLIGAGGASVRQNTIAITARNFRLGRVVVINTVADDGANTWRCIDLQDATTFNNQGFIHDVYAQSLANTQKTINAHIVGGAGIQYCGCSFEDVHATGMFLPDDICQGRFIRCSSGYGASFCHSAASSYMEDCVSFGQGTPTGSFYGTTTYHDLGYHLRCISGDSAFFGYVYGTYVDCEGKDYAFGQYAAGRFIRCQAGERSFGGYPTTGVPSGTFIDCVGGDRAWGYTNSGGATAACKLIRCRSTGRAYAVDHFQGSMEDCVFEVNAGDVDCVILAAAARIYGCTLVAHGTGKSINAGGAVTAQVGHCRLNLDIGVNVTNSIGTPSNIVDTDVTV